MGDSIIHRRIPLQPRHRPTGKTRHYREERELPAPAALEIGHYTGDSGFHLFYLGAAGGVMPDTSHGSLEDDMSRAEWEFGVGEGEWLVPSSGEKS